MGAYGIMDASDIYIRNLKTKEMVYIPYLNKFSLDLKGGEEIAKKKGRRAITFKKPIEGTFDSELEVLNSQIMALMLGSKLVKASADVFEKEFLTVSTVDELTIAQTPVADSLTVSLLDDDGVVTVKAFNVITTGTVATGEVKLTGSTIDFFAGEAPVGEKFLVTYLVSKPNMNKFTVYGLGDDVYYSLYANVQAKSEETGAYEIKQLNIPKFSISNELKLDFDAEKPSSFALKGSLLATNTDELVSLTDL